ncbi:MAG: succinylglutamate-semialdehyde dehydrogenase [Pseudomonadota bacterium]
MKSEIFIDGVWRPGRGEPFHTRSPVSGEETFSANAATLEDVESAVLAARRAQPDWGRRPVSERIDILEKYRDIILRDAEKLARLISRQTGKPLWETKTEAAAVAGKIDISVRAHNERTGDKTLSAGETNSRLRHRPHGVLAVLGPFNFPAHLPNGHIVPALIAGNTVVFKPSELAPAPGAFLAEALEEAGAPPGVFNLLQGGRETGEALVNADVNGLLFTGGQRTGAALARQLADRPDKILALELGGNNPLVWWDTDDRLAAAYAVVQSAFLTAGQRCTCARRLIVPEGADGDAAIAALLDMTARVIVADPFADPQPFMGPVISRDAAERLDREFASLIGFGGKVLHQPTLGAAPSAFFSPGVIDMTKADDAPDEELFGPILQIYREPNFDAAIARANATRFGLSAGLLSDDPQHWDEFRAHIRAGIVNWNRQTTGASSAAPFGGVGLSGNHRPSAYYAADYCAYPVASMESETLSPPPDQPVGLL